MLSPQAQANDVFGKILICATGSSTHPPQTPTPNIAYKWGLSVKWLSLVSWIPEAL